MYTYLISEGNKALTKQRKTVMITKSKTLTFIKNFVYQEFGIVINNAIAKEMRENSHSLYLMSGGLYDTTANPTIKRVNPEGVWVSAYGTFYSVEEFNQAVAEGKL